MTQTSLFDAPALARQSDPVSSHSAAEHVTVAGVASAQRLKVLEALQAAGPSTSKELSAASGLCRFMCARRLPELLRLGLVTRSGPRPCKAGGLDAMEWRIEREPK